MAFVHHALNAWSRATGIGGVAESEARKAEFAAPQVPDPNDAANAAQASADALRARRGLLSNIYAGAVNQQPVVGKASLGT